MNQTLKMIDLKSVTQDFYDKLVKTVNQVRNENQKIEFRRDAKFLRQRQPVLTDWDQKASRCLSAEKQSTRNFFDE